MQVTYLDCTDDEAWAKDNERRVKDKYYLEDPELKDKYLIDDADLSYMVEDCALVRTTGQFPFHHQVQTTESAGAYTFGNSMYLNDAISSIVRAKYPQVMTDEEYEKYQEEMAQYQVYSELHRDTLHFTINGLVQSSMYGNFDDRDYIMIEPLAKHIDSPLKSLRPEDTYFKGDMTLSDESSLIISEEVYEKIKDDPAYADDLKRFNLFVYKGNNQAMAVKQALNNLGYDNFLISNSYYTMHDHGLALQMTEFLSSYAQEHNISQTKHSNSIELQEEHEIEIARNSEIAFKHLQYILEHGGVSQELAMQTLEFSKYEQTAKFKELTRQVVEEIGLDEIAKLTSEFNQNMIVEHNKLTAEKPQVELYNDITEEILEPDEDTQEKTL